MENTLAQVFLCTLDLVLIKLITPLEPPWSGNEAVAVLLTETQY